MASSDREAGAAQFAARELADAFRAEDMAALGRLTAAGREEQEHARGRVARFVDLLWDEVKARRGARPGDGAYDVAAGMRDVALGLYGDARSARREAGDLDG
jgi:hypothetical protein